MAPSCPRILETAPGTGFGCAVLRDEGCSHSGVRPPPPDESGKTYPHLGTMK